MCFVLYNTKKKTLVIKQCASMLSHYALIKQSAGQEEEVCFSYVLKELVKENIPGLPPGGGLAAKQGLLDKIYREFYPEHTDSSDTFDCQAELAEAFGAN
ncbi:unnamed protein product [Euphydryas editha]|uniref:Protein serine/threonine phosphatase 2C C-terminal domain-containing protein n=1 Tax=Euphydryas editha TaxID=104508 RepID=A0AAU9U5B1_EUPED|nr:unnamed protein product [Euphydryas editha]